MRVLHVIDGLGGSGGAERRFVEELESWPAPDVHRVLRLFPYDDLSERLMAQGIPVHPLDFAPRWGSWSWPLVARRIAVEIDSFAPDVVHTSLFHADLAGQLAARWRRVPVVSSLVNAPRAHPSRRAAALDRLRFAVSRRTGARWRAVTRAAASSAVAAGAQPGAITVIPRGIGVSATSVPADRGAFGLPDGVPLVVHLARQARSKGQVVLVHAVARVRQTHPDVHLVIAGRTGDASADLSAAVAETGLGDAFHDLGFRRDADRLLACATVVVRPSLEEGFAAGVLEAVAAGKPAIASDIPPHREVAGPLGLATFVEATDVEGWAAAIGHALDEPPSQEELEARRRDVRASYSIDAAAIGLRRLLADVAGIEEASPNASE